MEKKMWQSYLGLTSCWLRKLTHFPNC